VQACLYNRVDWSYIIQAWPTMAREPHVAFCPVSCSYYVNTAFICVWVAKFCTNCLPWNSGCNLHIAWKCAWWLSWRVIFATNLAEQRYVCEWEMVGWCSLFMCAHVYTVALCSNTVRNASLGLRLLDHSRGIAETR